MKKKEVNELNELMADYEARLGLKKENREIPDLSGFIFSNDSRYDEFFHHQKYRIIDELEKLEQESEKSNEMCLYEMYKNLTPLPKSEYPEIQKVLNRQGFTEKQHEFLSQLNDHSCNCAFDTLRNLDDSDFFSPTFLLKCLRRLSDSFHWDGDKQINPNLAILGNMCSRYFERYKNSDSKTQHQLNPLVSALKDYAEYTEWTPNCPYSRYPNGKYQSISK